MSAIDWRYLISSALSAGEIGLLSFGIRPLLISPIDFAAEVLVKRVRLIGALAAPL